MKKILKDFLAQLSKTIFIVIAIGGVLLTVSNAWATIYYMPDDFADLHAAFAGMNGGDTLIIRDGTYTGAANEISHTQKPPAGTPNQYTTVKSEHDGNVIFYNVSCLVSATSYVKYEGLLWHRVAADKPAVTVSSATHPHHIKFLRCGVWSERELSNPGREDGFSINHCDYVLLEDCYAYGNMRYAFYVGGSADHTVLRRCVARIDGYNTETEISAFMVYDARNVEIQNCIGLDLDVDSSYLNNGSNWYPCLFYYRQTESGYNVENVNVSGSIFLNSVGKMIAGSSASDINFNNVVFWDGNQGNRSRNGGASANHMTIGKIASDTTWSDGWYSENGSEPIMNSIISNIRYRAGIRNTSTLSDFNALYNNSTNYSGSVTGPHDFSVENNNDVNVFDNSLKYLVRIEDGTALDGKASDSGDIGATVLYKIGVSGTLYGETGYNTITSERLWPFPNEDLIKLKMKAFDFNGVSGNRGFCADGKQLNGIDTITLTSYIWEYLGNPIPPEIYGGEPPSPDTTPPVISNTGATTTTTTATISWTTNESANGQVDYGETVSYGQQQTTSLTTNHQITISGLEPATTYHYRITCTDSSGNSSESTDFTFATQEANSGVTYNTLQDFEDGVVWQPGGSQDPTGNGRGWAFSDAGTSAKIEVDSTIGANGTQKSLKVTFDSDNPQIYFRSDDKITDHMPEAAGANRMSFYVRFPEGFPIQPEPFRYDTWQLGTYIHDPNDWGDTHAATYEGDHGIHHYYHRLTIEQVGNGWVKYIVTTQPDQANYSGSTVPPDISHYFDSFGRFYFHFGPEAGGPAPSRPFTIWIDEIKFYHDDGTVGGQVHVGGQDDAGFDGEFFPDSSSGGGEPSPDVTPPVPPSGLSVH